MTNYIVISLLNIQVHINILAGMLSFSPLQNKDNTEYIEYIKEATISLNFRFTTFK